jgi:hypothetical protein
VTAVERVGRSAIRGVEAVGHACAAVMARNAQAATRRPVIGRRRRWRATMQQMLTVGADALPMATVMSFCIRIGSGAAERGGTTRCSLNHRLRRRPRNAASGLWRSRNRAVPIISARAASSTVRRQLKSASTNITVERSVHGRGLRTISRNVFERDRSSSAYPARSLARPPNSC